MCGLRVEFFLTGVMKETRVNATIGGGLHCGESGGQGHSGTVAEVG